MNVIPNCVADETGTDPAILNPECLHSGKALHNMWLLPEELDYLFKTMHAGKSTYCRHFGCPQNSRPCSRDAVHRRPNTNFSSATQLGLKPFASNAPVPAGGTVELTPPQSARHQAVGTLRASI
jgi:hypothetical protein